MIQAPHTEEAWLASFFASPNELTWASFQSGTAPAEWSDFVRASVQALSLEHAKVVLPFMRNGSVAGWYAAAEPTSASDLGADLDAWFGPTYLDRFEHVPRQTRDAMAQALRDRFGGTVYRFSGPDMTRLNARVKEYAALSQTRPDTRREIARPVGAIRASFDRALLTGDERAADALIGELRATGRLNEENLRFLDVRLKAGLGRWSHIARDHWLIKTLADLALPPQVLSDLVEALYRTYLDTAEASEDQDALLDAFKAIGDRYPRLFASRHGVRTARVVKAFMLHERLSKRPDTRVMEGLRDLLPSSEQEAWFGRAMFDAGALSTSPAPQQDAEAAFEDGRYDKAFELFLQAGPSKVVIGRLLSCALVMNDPVSTARFLEAFAAWPNALIEALSASQRDRIEALRSQVTPEASSSWMTWAEQLARGEDLAGAEAAASASSVWDGTALVASHGDAERFSRLLGNLDGEAALVARRAIGPMITAFFPEGMAPASGAKPIGATLFMLVAMEDGFSRTDLEVLTLLLAQLLDLGLSSDEYVSTLSDLADVQSRVGSFVHLPWSLDICEVLAVAPAPMAREREARLGFFMQVIGQARSFAHRLGPEDWLPLEYLLPDFGLAPDTLDGLKPAKGAAADGATQPDLTGKTIGIYTLAEGAGARAQSALVKMFPGCKVVVNSDLVCTDQLTNLAETADVFVFAWKSGTHQALYCLKKASMKVEPAYAAGKGTASILRAVAERVK